MSQSLIVSDWRLLSHLRALRACLNSFLPFLFSQRMYLEEHIWIQIYFVSLSWAPPGTANLHLTQKYLWDKYWNYCFKSFRNIFSVAGEWRVICNHLVYFFTYQKSIFVQFPFLCLSVFQTWDLLPLRTKEICHLRFCRLFLSRLKFSSFSQNFLDQRLLKRGENLSLCHHHDQWSKISL